MVDTNVAVYNYDADEPEKQRIAKKLIYDLTTRGEFTLSTQVLAEFYNSTTSRKRGKTILSEDDARDTVAELAAAATVYPVTETVIRSTMGAMAKYKMSLWDAIIWATAKENGEATIYTEDIPGGVSSDIEGVAYVNPFAPPARNQAPTPTP